MSNLSKQNRCVAVAIATYHRDRELVRLFDSLAQSSIPITGGVFVADNAASPETSAICLNAPLPVHWLPRSLNNGPGPAWNTAISAAMQNPTVTHILVLDDDVVIPPHAIDSLLRALHSSQASAAAPLLFDENHRLWGFPEPKDKLQRALIRSLSSPEQCLAAFGDSPHPFCWATGACMLYARDAFSTTTPFREDFWMLGEDLELSMRTAMTHGGVFAAVPVPHLPPPPSSPQSSIHHHLKFLALLQNLSYLSFHSPHSSHMRRYLAGNYKRFFLTFGFSLNNLLDAANTLWHGAIKGCPAGHPSGTHLRQSSLHRLSKDLPE